MFALKSDVFIERSDEKGRNSSFSHNIVCGETIA